MITSDVRPHCLLIARTWIQSNFINGTDVTWGSQDVLKGRNITVRDIEELAIQIGLKIHLKDMPSSETRIPIDMSPKDGTLKYNNHER